MTKHDFSQYSEHRTYEQLRTLLHNGIWLPVLRGFPDENALEDFPGWDWFSLSETLQAAGVLLGGPGPMRCDPRVRTVHFSGPTKFAVEWMNGDVTVARVLLAPRD